MDPKRIDKLLFGWLDELSPERKAALAAFLERVPPALYDRHATLTPDENIALRALLDALSPEEHDDAQRVLEGEPNATTVAGIIQRLRR